jgi:glucuronokinase
VVYMDFERAIMQRQGFGQYEEIDPQLLPPLYIAYRADLAEGTEVFHNNIRSRWERGDAEVVEAMQQWARLTEQVREILLKGGREQISPILDANFDLRRRIYNISPNNLLMVETARSTGASAKFTGSGGAIVGVYKDDAMYQELEKRLGTIGIRVFKPNIVRSTGEMQS